MNRVNPGFFFTETDANGLETFSKDRVYFCKKIDMESNTILLLFITTVRKGCDKELLNKYFGDMVALSKKIEGFKGMEVFGEGNRTITVAKFSGLDAVTEFRNHPDHIPIMAKAGEFFSEYELIVASQIRATGHKIP